MTKKIKIYLADDHQVLIDGMKAVMKTNPNFEFVGFALNGTQLIEKVIASGADILIMDINMPEKDGLQVMKELSDKEFTFKIIILSSYDELRLVKEVMNHGASAYLTKQCAGENIVESINVVMSGEEYFCQTIREKIFNSFAQKNPKLNSNESGTKLSLTDRELEILQLISLEYSGKEISEQLFISTHTVESHRKNLIKKLDVKNTIGLVKYAMLNNLINP